MDGIYGKNLWIPAFAGMTVRGAGTTVWRCDGMAGLSAAAGLRIDVS